MPQEPDQSNTPKSAATEGEGSGAFTPGPWKIHEEEHGGGFTVRAGGPHGIILADFSMLWADSDEQRLRQDARLIAAAPELYEAARAAKALLIHDLEEPGRSVFWKLADAIAKAEGRS